MSVADNLARIREAIGPEEIKLIAVTKNVGLDSIEQAFQLGVTEFGENRVQDALDKQKRLPSRVNDNVHWHLIGHLQTNKVKQVVGRFALIHSVDSVHLAQAVSKEAAKRGITQAILLQVKVVPDESKFGFSPAQLREEFAEIAALPGLTIEGLMTMAPLTDDRQVWQACFAGLAALRDELAQKHGCELKELSMGMTQDWQEAVRCGATMIRLGRAIFAS